MQVLDKKRISVTSKRQLTIPQKFYTELGFGSEAICTLLDGALVIEPVSQTPSGEFDDLILADLIKEGYEGEALLAEFKARRANVRPAVERLIQQAKDVGRGNGEYSTYEEVFGNDISKKPRQHPKNGAAGLDVFSKLPEADVLPFFVQAHRV